MGAARLGDARRSRRLVRLVERLAEQPSASIPAACAGAAETKAAYRLLSHEAVGWSDILAPHLTSSLGRIGFELPAGRGRKARAVKRAVKQELRTQRVRLTDRHGGHVEVTCLIASEVDAPPGVKPVVWRLLTNREEPTLEAAVELVEWYRCRWEVEVLFLTLKEGCRVEAMQLSCVQRIERALAVYLVVA